MWWAGRAQPGGCRSVAEAAARLRCANSTGVWYSSEECGRSWLCLCRCCLPSTFASNTEAKASPFRNSSRNRQLKALAVGVLPRTTRLDVERLEPAPRDPLLHRLGHELGAVVAADILRRAAARRHRLVQDTEHVFGFHPPLDFQRHQFPAELIADRQPFEPPPVFGLVKNEVIAPHMVDPLGPQPRRARLRCCRAAGACAAAAALSNSSCRHTRGTRWSLISIPARRKSAAAMR